MSKLSVSSHQTRLTELITISPRAKLNQSNAGVRARPEDLRAVTRKKMLVGVTGIEHVVVTVMVGVTGY